MAKKILTETEVSQIGGGGVQYQIEAVLFYVVLS